MPFDIAKSNIHTMHSTKKQTTMCNFRFEWISIYCTHQSSLLYVMRTFLTTAWIFLNISYRIRNHRNTFDVALAFPRFHIFSRDHCGAQTNTSCMTPTTYNHVMLFKPSAPARNKVSIVCSNEDFKTTARIKQKVDKMDAMLKRNILVMIWINVLSFLSLTFFTATANL
eukprot:60201_1